MKKVHIITRLYLIAILLASTVFVSCDDYLDETPDNRQELNTLQSLSELLVTAYSEATYNFIEWRTDNVVDRKERRQKKWLSENFAYMPVVASESQDTPTYLWNQTYEAIAHSNQVLETLSKIEDNDTKKKNAIKGEALLTRAYNHFILASVFCQAYDEATASTVLGIPYITAPEKEMKVVYDRGTLKETYEKVEKDLLEGLPLLSNDYYKGTGKYHFNKGAAYAFASRFFLWKGDYEKCIEYANMLLGNGVVGVNFCRDYADIFKGSSSDVMANKFIDPEKSYNLLLLRKMTLGPITRYYIGQQPDESSFEQIYDNSVQGGEDHRKLIWGYSSAKAYNPPKYTELFEYTTATTGYPYFIMNELRAEEAILNRMEAYVKTGKIAEALADYNVYAPTRYKNGGQLTIEKIVQFYGGSEEEAMMKFIIDERRKEFLREGMRWWDIKRFKMAITHKDVEGNVYELKEEDLRKAVQIPQKAIINGIQENPR